MSTKIFDAFRIACSMEELHDLLSEYQVFVNEAAAELTHERYADLLAVHECNLIKEKIGMEPSSPLKNYLKDGFSLLTALYYKAMDAEQKIKKTGINMPQFDFMCEVVIYPFEGQFLLKFFTSKKEYLDILKTNSRFQEYEYWNNTDRPSYVSDIEWQARSADWDEVIQDMTWAQSGYTRQLYTGLKPLQPSKLVELMNKRYSKPKRLELFAQTILEEQTYMDPVWKDKKPYEITQFIKSDTAKPIIDDIKARIEDLLVEEYTADMLAQTKKE